MVPDYERILLRELAPACVVVDGDGVVQHFSGPVGSYLEPQGAPSRSVVGLAREEVRMELRAALTRSIRERATVVERCARRRAGASDAATEVVVRPLLPSPGSGGERWLVAFREVLLEPVPAGGGAASPVEDELRAELAVTRERLRTAIEELETSTAEERAANERLRALNDRLQTSQEELEALNQELQAVNEELSGKVEELDRLHGDLQNLLRSTDVAVVFLDRSLALQKFTPAATRLFRLVEADLGRSLVDLIPRFPIDGLLHDVGEVLRTSAPSERQVRVAVDGRWYLQRVLPYVAIGGATAGAVVTFADITEAKVAEAASRASEARLEQIVDSVPHLVWTASADGARDYFSQQWRDYTGLSAGPQLDAGWIEAYHPDDRAAMLAAWADAVRTGTPFEAEYRIRRHDGVYRWFKGRANPLRDRTGVVERWIGTSTDVDDVKRLEASLREGSRRKDEFLALLAHELRNPLAPLGNGLDMLRRHADPARVARAVEVIDRQVVHLTRLVDDLLDVSRITQGKIRIRRERLELGALVGTILDDHEPLFAAAGLRLERDLGAREAWVEGDPARLAQMVENLLQNARKFTDGGGVVTVTVAVEAAGSGGVSVRVRDTGVGMDPADVEAMFEAFAQGDASLARSRGGLGLGLTLVRALASLHGGSVSGASEGRGRGSEFVLRLPPAAPEPARAARPVAPPAPRRRVLVVDDNQDAAETFAELLRLEGHDVRVAGDGHSALEEARRFLPEVAFCDIGLPGALDGYALARALRGERGLEGALLVAMTGYATDDDRRRSREAGFDLHLAKPARIEVVNRALARWSPDGRLTDPPAGATEAAAWS